MKGILAGGLLLIACSACTQGAPASSSGAASGNPLAPTEIRVPLNVGTHMKGEHETPPHHDTHAQGQAIFQVSKDGLSVSYTLIASNIENVFASHIHQGAVGVGPGPIVVGLYSGAVGGGPHDGVLATGTITAANLVGPLAGKSIADLITLIEDGNAYVNVHTNDGVAPTNTGPGDYPGGEIRGQL